MASVTAATSYVPLPARIEADLRRLDAVEQPLAAAAASAFRTSSAAHEDSRREVFGELKAIREDISEIRSDVRTVKRTLNIILVAMLPFTGALIYFGQQVTGA